MKILSIQLVTNNKYARQVRSCAAAFIVEATPHLSSIIRGILLISVVRFSGKGDRLDTHEFFSVVPKAVLIRN